jgi:hypothetical protein
LCEVPAIAYANTQGVTDADTYGYSNAESNAYRQGRQRYADSTSDCWSGSNAGTVLRGSATVPVSEACDQLAS